MNDKELLAKAQKEANELLETITQVARKTPDPMLHVLAIQIQQKTIEANNLLGQVINAVNTRESED